MPVGFDNLTPFFSIVFAVNLDIDSGAFVLLAFVTGTHRMDNVQGGRQHCCWTLPPPSGSFAQLHYVEVAQRYLTCWCEESPGSNEQVEALDQEAKANRCLPFELLVHFLDLLAAWADLIIDFIYSSIEVWLHELIHHSTLATHCPLADLFAASLSLSANNHNLRPPGISRTSEALAILMAVVSMVLLCYAYN